MEKRIFIASTFTENMISRCDVPEVVIKVRPSTFDELRGEQKLITALKSEAMVNTLNDRYGIKTEVNPIKIQLQKGDVLYTISPSESIRELDELPDHVTLNVRRYEFHDQDSFIQSCTGNSEC